MIRSLPVAAVTLLALVLGAADGKAQLRGHGGPVRALAVFPDGRAAISGSFDTAAIRWSLVKNAAEEVLRFHDGAVNAVVVLPDGRVATSGEDARIALWRPGQAQPEQVLHGHTAPVAALAVSPDGRLLASAGWDRTVRLWPLDGGTARILEGHQDNANAVAFLPDGSALVSAGYDATVRIWPLAGAAPVVASLPTPLNAVATAPDGEIIAAGGDSRVYVLSPQGQRRGEIDAGQTPIIALAVSRDGALVAAAGTRGSVAVIDRRSRALLRTLVGPGLPVWSVAFLPDARTMLTGGTDRMIRRWDALTGDHLGTVAIAEGADPLAEYKDDPGAEVFRACVACHTLKPEQGERAGPTLAGLFGRRIASLPGYNFSEALRRMDIIWTKETVARLFEIGPAAYTPGTKMPEQRIGSAAERQALVDFLERATRN